MCSDPQPRPSFSTGRRWSIGLNVALMILLLFSVVVMVNYISRDRYLRGHWSTRTKIELAPRTVNFLKAMTNQVRVTLYYDQHDPFYSTIADLLKAYQQVNPALAIQTVDYLGDRGGAQKAKEAYRLNSVTDTNLVIFDCAGRWKPIPARQLVQYTLEQVPSDEGPTFHRKALAFLGELAFTSALLEVTSPKRLMACFLQGPNFLHAIDNGDELTGYLKFAGILQQNAVEVRALSLYDTNAVPPECNLLIIPGPRGPLGTNELEKIDHYLGEGGRLLALFNAGSVDKETGLEKILAKWGVSVGQSAVVDPEHSPSGPDVGVSRSEEHPVVNPVLGYGLYLVRPRTVSGVKLRTAPADAPHVEAMAWTGEKAFLENSPTREQRNFPVMVTVEKGTIPSVMAERGTTRMVVAGDSYFLANHQLDVLGNRDFAWSAVNWLLGRAQLVEGVGPQPVVEYRVTMTEGQLRSAEWLLLGGFPGGALLLDRKSTR